MSGAGRAIRRVLIALGLVALAGAWLLAADRLWDTSVPADLDLPKLDPSSYFTEAQIERAEEYQAFLRVDWLLASVAQLVVLGLYAWKGARFARESAAGRIGTGMLLGMLGLGFVWFSQFPFDLAALWWERDHEITEQGYLEWAINDFQTVGGQFLFISLALLIVMALARPLRQAWWLAAVPVLFAVGLAYVFLQPYLLPDLHRLRDERLLADTRALAEEQGVSDTDIRVQNTHDLTNAANAQATGIGSSRRVILWDTLLERFPRDETRVVIAHELGHLSRDHIWKHLAWAALLGIPVAGVVAVATRRRGGIYEPSAVPLALFVTVAALFILSPLQQTFSRRLEAEADWIALQTAADPPATKGVMQRFNRTALAEPDPPGWAQVLSTHPSIMRRIEMAEAWRARER